MTASDDPRKAFLAPRRLGWRTIRLGFSGRQRVALEAPAEEHAADVEVDDHLALARELGGRA